MGYESDLFVSQVDENLICTICSEIFKDPVSCKDGHTFCRECIENWLSIQDACPLDREDIKKERLTPNLTARGVVENLLVCCVHNGQHLTPSPKRRNGKRAKGVKRPRPSTQMCDWVGQLHSLQKHVEQCSYRLVPCPNRRCITQIMKKDLEKHLGQCMLRMAACEECGSKMPLLDLRQHKKEDCPFTCVPCVNKCHTYKGVVTVVARADMEQHLAECDEEVVSCVFSENGCHVKGCRGNMHRHLANNVVEHMTLVAKQNTQLQQQLEKVKANLKFQVSSIKNDLSNSYVWTISNFNQLFRDSHPGTSHGSPVLWLCGCSWRIRLFPKGSKGDQGFLSIFLEQCETVPKSFDPSVVLNSEITVLFRFSALSNDTNVPDHTMSSDEAFTFTQADREWGWSNFMTAGMALSPNYCDDGKLRLKCTMQLV